MNIFERLAKDNEANNFSGVSSSAEYTKPEALSEVITSPNQEVVAEAIEEPQGNIFEQMATQTQQKKDNELGLLGTLKDIGEQGLAKFGAGILGAYGNLLDAFGLQRKAGETVPGEQVRNSAQFEVLQKLNRGELPSFGELMLLSDDEGAPNLNRLPSSQDINQGVEALTGIGKGKTPHGRIIGNAAQFVGEGIPTGGGGKALLSLGAAGAAGQGIREAGGPEALATGLEIATPIASTAITKNLAPLSKSGKEIVNAGRQIGLSEHSIAPLLQSEGKTSVLSLLARKGTRTKKVFAKLKEQLGDSYQTLKSNPQAKNVIPMSDQRDLFRKFSAIKKDLFRTLAPSPDKEAAIKYIDTALDTLRKRHVTPEDMINFWQDINKSVKWNSISGGKKSLARLKEPVSEVLHKNVPSIAQKFDMTNDLYSKYAQIAKKLKPDIVDSIFNKAELAGAAASGLALIHGNTSVFSSVASEAAIRVLAREMLISPYFQTIAGKLVHNFNSASVKSIQETVKQVQDYMKRKHPNEDWSFLTKDLKE